MCRREGWVPLDPVAPGIPLGMLWRSIAIGMMVNRAHMTVVKPSPSTTEASPATGLVTRTSTESGSQATVTVTGPGSTFDNGGIVAMGSYEHGTRFIEVAKGSGKIKEIGFFDVVPQSDEPEFDGVAEQWFASEQDFVAVYGKHDRPARAEALAHVSRMERLIVREWEF